MNIGDHQVTDCRASIRQQLNKRAGELLAPVTHWLNKLARRLDIEADMLYRANVDAINPHKYMRPTLAQDHVEFDLNRPAWVDKTRKVAYAPLDDSPHNDSWPDISDTSANKATTKARMPPSTTPAL